MNKGLVGRLRERNTPHVERNSPLTGTTTHKDRILSDLLAVVDYMEEAAQRSSEERLEFDVSSITYDIFNNMAGIDGTYGEIPIEIFSDGQRLLIPTRFTLNGDVDYHPMQRLRDIAMLLPQDSEKAISFNPDQVEFKHIHVLGRFTLQFPFGPEEKDDHENAYYGY